MTELIEPVKPDVIDPEPHPAIAGDYTDDDGQVLDEWFEAMPLGPQERDTVPVPVTESIPHPTRIISRTIPLSETSEPIQVFAADVNRKDLIVQVSGTLDSTHTVTIGSDKSDIYNAAGVQLGASDTTDLPTTVEFRTDKHTGAVWVYYTGTGAGTVTVNAWSVTE